MIHIEEDLEKDIHKIDAVVDEAFDDGKMAAKLGEDVIKTGEDWKQAISSGSYIVNQIPDIVDALEDCGNIASDCEGILATATVGGNPFLAARDMYKEKGELKAYLSAIEKVYQDRQQLFHSVITLERWANNVVTIVKRGKELCDKHDKRAQEKAERAKESLIHRMKPHKVHGKLLGSKARGAAHEHPAGTPHVSIKKEAESIVSSMDEKVTHLIDEGEGIERFLSKNETTIDTLSKDINDMKTEWKPAVQAVAGIQSVIPLAEKAFHEIGAIAKLIKDTFGAATLNPVSIISLIEDGRQVFEDAEAIYDICEKIDAILESLDALKLFVKAATGTVNIGHALLLTYRKSMATAAEKN